MSEFKGTKGEWIIDEIDEDEKYEIYPALDGPPNIGRWAEICVVKDYHGNAKENAHLISAAPDMLEALIATRAALVRLAWEENSLMIEGIDTAIAKALGETK